MDGLAFMVAFDFDAKEPVEFSKVSDLHIFGDLTLEGDNEQEHGCGDCAVVDVNDDNDGSMTIVTTVTVEHCLVHITSHKP